MNNELLNKIKAHIKAEPRRIWMSTFITHALRKGYRIGACYEYGKWNRESGSFDPAHVNLKTVPPCGTMGCIAGWAGMIGDGTFTGQWRARELLGIGYDQADKLFFVCNWPAYYRRAYNKARSAKARAEVVVKRIAYFQRTKGAK